MIYQLEKHIADLLKDFFKTYEFINKVVVFGSRAKHNANPKSDIDLCVYSSKMSDKEFSKLRLEIDDLPILQKLDVVHFEKVNAELQNNVEKDGKLLYKKVKKVKKVKLGDVLKYEQPTKYIVSNDMYDDSYSTPVLTAGKTFLLGYTNETENIFTKTPVIIFDDFTTAIKYVDFPFKVKSSAMKILNPTDEINIRYMFYLMSTIKSDKGLHKRYWISKYSNMEVSLPSLQIQNQIAKTLDKANELINLRKESITKLDALAKSIFIDMFGDPVSNPKGWEITTCIDESSCIVPGRDKPKSFTGTLKWVTTGDLKDRRKLLIKDIILGLNDKEIAEVKAKIIPKNSVIFTCVGDLGIVSITDEDIVMNQQLHSFQCKENLNNVFLMFNISYQKPYMYKFASQTTVPYMNKTTCNNIPLILPPIDLQNKFAEIIEKIEEQKSLYEKELELLQNNFDALLQKSFQE